MLNKGMIIGFLVLVAIVVAGLGISARIGIERAPTAANENTRGAPRFAWDFQMVGTDAVTSAPQTTVTLTTALGRKYDAGTYAGSCSVIDGIAWKLREGEVSGVICWFAGGGSEVGVFREGDKLVVKKGELDEGSAETPGFRGNFTTLFKVR